MAADPAAAAAVGRAVQKESSNSNSNSSNKEKDRGGNNNNSNSRRGRRSVVDKASLRVVRALEGFAVRLPRPLLVLSTPFYAFHFLPVFALMIIATIRLFVEIMFNLLDYGNIWLIISATFIFSFGVLHFHKILLDCFWDFLSFHTPTTADHIINPDAHKKLVAYVRWREHRKLPRETMQLAVFFSSAVVSSVTVFLMQVMKVADICCYSVAAAVALQSVYIASLMRVHGVEKLLGLDNNPMHLWNESVFIIRIIGMCTAIVGAGVAANIGHYSFGALEPYLFIASGQALYFTLNRLASDVIDGIIDVSENYSLVARLAYSASIVMPVLLTAYLTSNSVLCVIFAFASGSFVHAALECTGNFSMDMNDFVYRRKSPRWRNHISKSQKPSFSGGGGDDVFIPGGSALSRRSLTVSTSSFDAEQAALEKLPLLPNSPDRAYFTTSVSSVQADFSNGPAALSPLSPLNTKDFATTGPAAAATAASKKKTPAGAAAGAGESSDPATRSVPTFGFRAFVTFASLVWVLPWVPCSIVLLVASVPPRIGQVILVVTVVLFVSTYLFKPPKTLRPYLRYLSNLMSGLSLFFGELSPDAQKIRRSWRRLPGIQIDKRTMLRLTSVALWIFVLFTQGSMIEHTMNQPAAESYFFKSYPKSDAVEFIYDFKVFDNPVSQGHFRIQNSPSAANEPVDDEVANRALCSFRLYNLSILEYSFLAASAYVNDQQSDDVKHLVERVLPDCTFRTVARTDANPVVFHDYYCASRNLSVIVIKGTHITKLIDWIQDLDIWLEVAMFQFSQVILPGLQLWPADHLSHLFASISAIGKVLNVTDSFHHKHRFYYGPIVHYINSIRDRRVAIVGHSLGGGLAQIVSAKTKAPAISFSGPGFMENQARFGIDPLHMVEKVVNVVPFHDIVPMIGTLGGTTFHWDCKYDSLTCHSPVVLPCAIMDLCPNSRMQCLFAGKVEGVSLLTKLKLLV